MLYGYDDRGRSYCRCTCDCGNECIKESYGLKSAKYPPSCGCLKDVNRCAAGAKCRKDYTGMKFGRATVTAMLYRTHQVTKVACICDCGKSFITNAPDLVNGHTQSCGCLQRQATSYANTKDFSGIVSPYGVKFISPAVKLEVKPGCHVWLWNCECGCCGKSFIALPAKVLNGHITSCGCAKASSGERLVEGILNDLDIQYVREYSFKDCRNEKSLRFDFYLPNYNIVIEYQGKQHYEAVDLFGGDSAYQRQVENDHIKRDFCNNNKITLLELPYSLSSSAIQEMIIKHCESVETVIPDIVI